MSSSHDILSPEGLRVDGRRARELRRLFLKLNPIPHASGSSYLTAGNTRVIAAVHGPSEPKFRSHDSCILSVEVNVAPFATNDRKQRSKSDRRLMELSIMIREALTPALMLSWYPRSQISVYIQVLQEDGGLIAACINAATLALVHAGIGMKEMCIAANVGVADDAYTGEKVPMLDLCRVEETSRSPDLTVAYLPLSGGITFLQMESKMPLDVLEACLKLARAGTEQIRARMETVIRKTMDKEEENEEADQEMDAFVEGLQSEISTLSKYNELDV